MRITAFRSTPAGIGPVLDLIASTVACFMEFFFFSFFFLRRRKKRQAEKEKGEGEMKPNLTETKYLKCHTNF